MSDSDGAGLKHKHGSLQNTSTSLCLGPVAGRPRKTTPVADTTRPEADARDRNHTTKDAPAPGESADLQDMEAVIAETMGSSDDAEAIGQAHFTRMLCEQLKAEELMSLGNQAIILQRENSEKLQADVSSLDIMAAERKREAQETVQLLERKDKCRLMRTRFVQRRVNMELELEVRDGELLQLRRSLYKASSIRRLQRTRRHAFAARLQNRNARFAAELKNVYESQARHAQNVAALNEVMLRQANPTQRHRMKREQALQSQHMAEKQRKVQEQLREEQNMEVSFLMRIFDISAGWQEDRAMMTLEHESNLLEARSAAGYKRKALMQEVHACEEQHTAVLGAHRRSVLEAKLARNQERRYARLMAKHRLLAKRRDEETIHSIEARYAEFLSELDDRVSNMEGSRTSPPGSRGQQSPTPSSSVASARSLKLSLGLGGTDSDSTPSIMSGSRHASHLTLEGCDTASLLGTYSSMLSAEDNDINADVGTLGAGSEGDDGSGDEVGDETVSDIDRSAVRAAHFKLISARRAVKTHDAESEAAIETLTAQMKAEAKAMQLSEERAIADANAEKEDVFKKMKNQHITERNDLNEAHDRELTAMLNLVETEMKEKKQQETMDAVFGSMTDPLIMSDRHGTIQLVNNATCVHFGYTREELIGSNVNIITPDAIRDEHQGYIERYLRTGEPRIINTRGRQIEARKKDGTHVPMQLCICATVIDDALVFIASIHDMKYVRKQQAEIQRKSEEMQAIMSAMRDAMVVTDDKHIITFFNDAAADLFGYSASEVIGSAIDTLCPDQVADSDSIVAVMHRLGSVKVDTAVKERVVARSKSGATIPVLMSSSMSEVAGQTMFILTFLDASMLDGFSEREQSAALYLKAVLDGMRDPMIVTDEVGTISTFNASASRLFGYTADEVNGRNVDLLMPPEVAHHHASYMKRYTDTGVGTIIGTKGRRVLGKHKCGEQIPLLLSITRSDVNGKRIYIGNLHDLRDGLETEQAVVKFTSIMAAIADPVIVCDAKGVCQTVNSAALRLFGYTESELVGENIRILTPMSIRSHHDKYITDYFATGKAKIVGQGGRLVTAVRKDGSRIRIILSLSRVQAGEETLLVANMADVDGLSKKFASAVELQGSQLTGTEDSGHAAGDGAANGAGSGAKGDGKKGKAYWFE